ncbi:MAG: transposase [Sphingobacteriales bacterium]|nr:MAG: transposase [Sphingobacteriales bacterium]
MQLQKSKSNRQKHFGKALLHSKYRDDSERACRITREHWGIENKLHWVLDAVMGEDKSKKRAGNTGANFSVLQKIALNIIKNHDDPKANTKRKFRKCLFSDAYLESTLKIS